MEIVPYIPECRCAKVIKILKEDVTEEVEYWKHSIVGYLMGKHPYFPHFNDFLKRIWKTAGNFKLISLPKGFFMVRFDNANATNSILQRIHTYQGRPMILKRWDKNVNLEKEVLGSIPIWVRLFNLPMYCRGKLSIARVCSQFSIPLYPDKATLTREREGFVKVVVEVDVHDELPEVVNIDIHGIDCEVYIEYDWKPQLCRKCNGFNHSEAEITDIGKSVPAANESSFVENLNSLSKEVDKAETNVSPDDTVGALIIVQEEIGLENVKCEGSVPLEVSPLKTLRQSDSLNVSTLQESNPSLQKLDTGKQVLIPQDRSPLTKNQKKKLRKKEADMEASSRITRVETRVQSSKFVRISSRIRANWQLCHNYDAVYGGRIWCGWNPTIFEVQIMEVKAQVILLKVKIRNTGLFFWMSGVYGENTVEKRRDLWKYLTDMSNFISGPWLLLGDWNVVRSNGDKLRGEEYSWEGAKGS
ncbi:uncharacterized protein LOC132309187 [Cornus florida]|uniref:uncharacterized protein LOC132309187 n=1 Tax=Cornus florida TaxID=4283 RepID=UPI00289DB5DA|nr:uncharacterized protein LOC132309187 [Cornus florida]